MNRGQRSVNKTKSAIKNALLELIRSKNYPVIKVGEITDTADVGRSTFYKHYPSKADVLVDIHTDIFQDILKGLSSKEKWMSPNPTQDLWSFFERMERLGRNPFSLSYKLGSDLDYLVANINIRLTSAIKQSLLRSFNDSEFLIPLPVLAQSVSSLYSALIMAWFTQYRSADIKAFAGYIQKMSSALILEAMKDKHRKR